MSKKSDLSKPENWHPDTRLVRGGTMRSEFGETSEALFLNSGFCYDSAETAESRFDGSAPGFVYSRYLNPTLKMLEDRLALLEGCERACVMASGMAAVFAAMMCQLRAGDHVVANKVLFGSCFHIITEILPQFGITYTLVEAGDNAAWEAAITEKTRLVFIESPANPTLDLVDIRAVTAAAHQVGASVIVDNIFATPLLQHPFDLGADIVVYSTTKHMDGQGRTLGGAVLGPSSFIDDVLLPFHRHTGPALSPFNAWVILKGLETFGLRMVRHGENAARLADFLADHPAISRVLYPGRADFPQRELAQRQMAGGGGMIAFELQGGKEAAFRFLNALKIIDISNNLGDAKSLVTHPATTTHSNMEPDPRRAVGISDGLLRFSVGLENAADLEADLAQALECD